MENRLTLYYNYVISARILRRNWWIYIVSLYKLKLGIHGNGFEHKCKNGLTKLASTLELLKTFNKAVVGTFFQRIRSLYSVNRIIEAK